MTEAEALMTVAELSQLHPNAAFTAVQQSDGFWVVEGRRGAQKIVIVQRMTPNDHQRTS